MAKPDRKPPKKGKRSLRGKGPTPRAEDRPYHTSTNQRKRINVSARNANALMQSAAMDVAMIANAIIAVMRKSILRK